MRIKTNSIRINSFTRLLAALGIFLAFQQVAMIGLSLAQIVITQGFAIASLGLGALLGLAAWFWLQPGQPEPGRDARRWEKWVFGGLCVLLGLVYLALWYVAYLTPDLTCDGTAYHIPTISLWAHQGYIYWIDPNFQLETLVNGYPKAVELTGFVLIRATGLSELANTLNLIFLPLGVLSLTSLARSLGASKPLALFAGCLWVLIPVNLFQATTAYIDSAYGSLAIAFIAMLVAVQQQLRAGQALRWRLVPALGSVAGLTLAAKGSAGLLVGAGFLVLLTAALLSRILAGAADRGLFWRAILVALTAGVIALAVGGFWYVRNYVKTGTPLYPVGLKVGGQVIFPGATVSDALWEVGNTPEFMKSWGFKERISYTWTQTLVYRQAGVASWPESMMGVDSRIGGLGFLWLVGCIPALLYVLVSSLVHPRQRPERLSIWLVLGVVGIAFAGSPMNWWARYTVWLYALGLPALALALSDLSAARRWWLAPIWLWVIFSLGLGLYEGGLAFNRTLRDAYPGYWPPRNIKAWLPTAWHWPDGYLFPETRGTWLDRVMASNGPIAVGPLWGNAPGGRLQHNIFGQLSLPIGQRELLFIPANVTVDTFRYLKQHKVLYIIWDGNQELPGYLQTIAERVDKVPGFWIVTAKQY